MRIGAFVANNRYKIIDIKDSKFQLYDTLTTQYWSVTKEELQYLNGDSVKKTENIEWQQFFKIATENCGQIIYNIFDKEKDTIITTIVGKKIKRCKRKTKVVEIEKKEELEMGEKNNNNLLSLADVLFNQLEELNKKTVSTEDVQKANAICNVSSQILKTYDVALKVEKYKETRTTNTIGLLGNE